MKRYSDGQTKSWVTLALMNSSLAEETGQIVPLGKCGCSIQHSSSYRYGIGSFDSELMIV
ncbi:hypothetical protein O9993_06620 [Vibrio lentus]|nr:hypothetical protein [Vibrio lentus]